MSSLVSSPLDIYHTVGGVAIGFDNDGYFIIHQGDDREIKTCYGFGVKAFKEARQDMESRTGLTFKEIRQGVGKGNDSRR